MSLGEISLEVASEEGMGVGTGHSGPLFMPEVAKTSDFDMDLFLMDTEPDRLLGSIVVGFDSPTRLVLAVIGSA